MAETASTLGSIEENPSLDPAAIERAYRLQRARRRAKVEHREYARNSNARFWVMVAVILLVTVVLGLTALREVQTSFGIFQ
jgi:hypothetical protein